MTQTAIKIGNSVGMVIPAEFRKKVGIKQGSKLDIQTTPDDKLVVGKMGNGGTTSKITPEFLDWLKKFNKEYGTALQELAKK